MKKWSVLAGSLLMLVCLGGIYAWSAFVPPLREFGLSAAQTQLIFGVSILSFTVIMLGAGRLQERVGPRPVAALGGVLFAAGYLVAAHSAGRFAPLLAGVGVLAGAGVGCAYVCALATGMKWFPHHRGLITGVTVAAFGLGAIVLANAATALMGRGVGVLTVFEWVGWICGAAVLAGALLLDVPPQFRAAPAVRGIPLARLLQDRNCWVLSMGIFGGTFAGLLVIGNLKPIALAAGADPSWAVHAISGFAVGNALGRVVWGHLVDRLGRIAIPISLLFLSGAVLALTIPALGGSLPGVAALVGFGYGACFVLYPAQVATRYGVAQVGHIYPLIFLLYGVAGLTAPLVGGLFHDLWGTYVPAIFAAGSLTALCAAGCWLLDRAAPLAAIAIAPSGAGRARG